MTSGPPPPASAPPAASAPPDWRCRPWSSHLPGSGGALEARSEDFEVREVPAYLPSGRGQHLYLRVEKRGLTTPEAAHHIAARLERPARDVAWAGLKDKDATTEQWLSIEWPEKAPLPALDALSGDAVRVLEASRHGNKLRAGHLHGNRFHVRVRGVDADGVARAQAVLTWLRAHGVPNAFGAQRFGLAGDNALRARAILGGERPAPRDRRLARLLESALQSWVFNRLLDARIADGTLARALLGDVMQKHTTGGMFVVDDVAATTPRVEALELSPTGLMPGPRARAAEADVAERERAVLAALDLDDARLARLRSDGTRRLMRYPLDPDARVEADGPDAMRVEVTLPPGAFVTVLLAELMKPEGGVVERSASSNVEDEG
jgi:tRNA pseudouridine13 synthase